LRDFIEEIEPIDATEESGRAAVEQDQFEILKESPMLGDGKFKLEIGIH
jgi:hypothetical protein